MALTGCGGGPEIDEPMFVGSASEPIMGGYNDPNDTNVVAIFDSSVGGLCSGSLIAPNVVLTARHCVSSVYNEINGGVSCAQTTFGPAHAAGSFFVTTKPSISQNPGDYHSVKKVVLLPTDNKFCGQDQAILILNDVIDQAEAVPRVPRVDTPLATGEEYFAIGYGGTTDTGAGAGTRRRRDSLYVSCVSAECPSYYVSKQEWVGDQGICEGDSGGPAVDMQGRSIGVTSRGAAGCQDPVYGYVFEWGQWIKDTTVEAAGIGGYPPPPWATGFPTDPQYTMPVGDACQQPTDCASDHCVNDGVAQYCTRLCTDVAVCPDGYTCDPSLSVCLQQHPPPAAKKHRATQDTSSSCSISRGGGADPTKPIPWFAGAVGAFALLRRRRRE